ncbi:hypothetical protein C1752_00661 [Acaryochloris thomasi RCC1774]|uniref:Uncharacterized protein n=1 Tax=Acaryochloris thomasi RCC1774 TaxID=1764569 RepID=A0A2W1JNM9_9CYAN|nr:hypothetical protein [Acaryochloris thomasi]PZD74899.1 hypothetical protein C1752_00661 [Acaryochloris thomasi RCC1774]
MKSLSLPALLSLLPLLSFVGSTQAKPRLSEPPQNHQPPAAKVTERHSQAPITSEEIEAITAKVESTRAEQPTPQVEQPKVPLTTPLYQLEDPRHSFDGNCPACGMG